MRKRWMRAARTAVSLCAVFTIGTAGLPAGRMGNIIPAFAEEDGQETTFMETEEAPSADGTVPEMTESPDGTWNGEYDGGETEGGEGAAEDGWDASQGADEAETAPEGGGLDQETMSLPDDAGQNLPQDAGDMFPGGGCGDTGDAGDAADAGDACGGGDAEGAGDPENAGDPGDAGGAGDAGDAADAGAAQNAEDLSGSAADNAGEGASDAMSGDSLESTPENPAEIVVREESFVPAERVGPEELRDIVGLGVDAEVDPHVDAVMEILNRHPDDEGLLQMAAEHAGLTEEAAAEAAAVLLDEHEALPEETAEAIRNAGYADAEQVEENTSLLALAASLLEEEVYADEDRQNGKSVAFVPAARAEDAMCVLSSFVLSEVRDGAGDYDDPASYTAEGDGYDWKGNDSNDKNGVVRTYDDLTYVFSYATALTPAYIYNTIRGTRLYVEYSLPMADAEAVFNTAAMPWLKGDGEDGKPVVYYTLEGGEEVLAVPEGAQVISQRLVGYRELPDRKDEHGEAYDVPGAGTLNCVINVRDAALRQEIRPAFSAWLSAPDNSRAPESGSGIVKSIGEVPPVYVTVGSYVAIRYEDQYGFARTFDKWAAFSFRDGSFAAKSGSGRIKQVRFVIVVGKPGGTMKGTGALAGDKRVHVTFKLSGSATGGQSTEAGLFDLRTADMYDYEQYGHLYALNGPHGPIGEAVAAATVLGGMMPFDGCGSLDPGSLSASGGVYAFDILPGGNIHPGDTFSGGDMLFFSRQVKEAPSGGTYPTYGVTVTSEVLYATAEKGDGTEAGYSQIYTVSDAGGTRRVYPFYDLMNTVDRPGSWDSHMYLGTEASDIGMAGSGFFETSGMYPYGKPFTMTVRELLSVSDETNNEHSRKLFLLWDNRKVELDVKDGALYYLFWNVLSPGGNPSYTDILHGAEGAKGRMIFLTKKDGTCWSSEDEMRRVQLLNYNDLYMWKTYDAAVNFLAERGFDEGHICGVLVENFNYNLSVPSKDNVISVTVGMRMKDDLSLIGQSVMFTQSIISFKNNVTSSMGGVNGTGTLPDLSKVRMRWFIDAPRSYMKTERDETGSIIDASMGSHNHPHEGTSMYITGYEMQTESRILEGEIGSLELAAATRDLSGDNEVTYKVTPSFLTSNGVRGAAAALLLPVPEDQAGQRVMTLTGIAVKGENGALTRVQADGADLPLADFTDGAAGSFGITSSGLDDYMAGSAFSGDPFAGKTFVIRSAADRSLVLSDAGGVNAVTRAQGGSPQGEWRISRDGLGGYNLVSAETGRTLMSERGDVGAASNGDKLAFGGGMDSLHNRFQISRNEDGTVSIGLLSTNLRVSHVAAGAAAELKTAGGGAAQRWILEQKTVPSEGLLIRLKGLDDRYALPSFYLTYTYDKSLVDKDSFVTQKAFITENAPIKEATAANRHMASTGLNFVEVTASVLKETVDTKEVKVSELKRGRELTYTISYTNNYGEGHPLSLTDVIPHAADDDGSVLKSGAKLVVTAVSISGDAGSVLQVSSPEEINRTGVLQASGSMKSGETAVITCKVQVTGAAGGNVIRSSSLQRDPNGDVRSNRVETVIIGMSGEAQIAKTVNRISNATLENQTWTILSTIPEGIYADSDVIYEIRDRLDPEEKRLAYRGNVSVSICRAAADAGSGSISERTDGDAPAALVRGTDYTLEEPETESTGGTLSIRMKESGLQKLAERADGGSAVKVTFDTAITHETEAGIRIPNHADLTYGIEGMPEETKTVRSVQPDPYVYTGEIRLKKLDAKTGAALSGSSFALTRDEGGREAVMHGGAAMTAVSGADGKAVFHGIRDGVYYLREIRAAEGHELLASPLKVTVENGYAAGGAYIEITDLARVPLMAGGRGYGGYACAALLLLLAALSLTCRSRKILL